MNGSHIMKSIKFAAPILQSSQCSQRLNAPNGPYGLAFGLQTAGDRWCQRVSPPDAASAEAPA